MRLINSYEFKQKLLDDRDLLVPKTVNNMFAQAVRYGFHRALRCMEQCTTIEAEPVKHGKWVLGTTNHHEWMKCSECLHSYDVTGVFVYCPNCGAKMAKRKSLRIDPQT